MYFVERYLRSLKDYVKQHAKMEGSIAERYLIAEAMFYGSETLARLDPSAPLNSLADKEDEREVGEVVFGKKTKCKLDPVTLTHAHTFILYNAECMQSWLEEYERERAAARTRRERHTRTFLEYMRDICAQADSHGISQDVKDIVLGPYTMAKSYNTIWSKGRRFRRADLDIQSTRTQDSGVCASFLQECRTTQEEETEL
ncbi:hypothetical protein R1sor_011181 [Riccia sorocarpa]|uniref:DUF4218 domain-containing protein n=1 Tax=Riccia sorocarpa TaxID=122646 RepID=A0ABD3I3S8_9MARC